MKEVIKDFKDNEIEISIEKEQRKEIKLIGRQRKIPGLTTWEFNVRTKELKEAQYKKEDVSIKTLNLKRDISTKHNKVIVNTDCIYFQALNRKSALKRLSRLLTP